MANFNQHTRIIYSNYGDIQNAINDGKIDAFDLVICKDTSEFVFITKELSMLPLQCRVYRFDDIESAEEFLNESHDSYEGQIVAILYNGKYTGYIANKNNSGLFEVSPLNQISGEIDYNALSHRPIENIQGNLSNPIILNALSDGVYKIKGQYQLAVNAKTTYLSPNSNIFLIQHDNNTTYIKKISATDIIDYTVDDNDGSISSSTIATTDYLMAQGYTTKAYVDNKIATLDFITRTEVESFVNNTVEEILDNILDDRIDARIDVKVGSMDQETIQNLF